MVRIGPETSNRGLKAALTTPPIRKVSASRRFPPPAVVRLAECPRESGGTGRRTDLGSSGNPRAGSSPAFRTAAGDAGGQPRSGKNSRFPRARRGSQPAPAPRTIATRSRHRGQEHVPACRLRSKPSETSSAASPSSSPPGASRAESAGACAIDRAPRGSGLPPGQGARQGHRAALRRAGPRRGAGRPAAARLLNSTVRGNDLRIAGSPSIQPGEAKDGELPTWPPFEVVPDFGDIDVAGLDVESATPPRSADEDIDRMVENLRPQRRTWAPVGARPSEGDAGRGADLVDGRASAHAGRGLGTGLTLIGSGWSCREIEQALAGMRAGEERPSRCCSRPDWRVPQLAGKAAQANLQVERRVRSRAARGRRGLHPQLRRQGRRTGAVPRRHPQQPRARAQGRADDRLRREVSEKLAAAYEHVEMPPRLVENEARMLAQQAAEQVRRQGGNPQMPENAHEAFLDAARVACWSGCWSARSPAATSCGWTPWPGQRDPAPDRLHLRGAAAGH